jgi:transcriptional regulator with XRE-family HTH domain
MNLIDKRLQELRTAHKLTQAQLAKKLGISRSAVNAWEMGISKPHIEYLAELSRIYNVSTDYILNIGRDTIDITDLSEKEKKVIIDLAAALRDKN